MSLTGCSVVVKTAESRLVQDPCWMMTQTSWIDSQSLRTEQNQLFNTSLEACGLNNNRSNKGLVWNCRQDLWFLTQSGKWVVGVRVMCVTILTLQSQVLDVRDWNKKVVYSETRTMWSTSTQGNGQNQNISPLNQADRSREHRLIHNPNPRNGGGENTWRNTEGFVKPARALWQIRK